MRKSEMVMRHVLALSVLGSALGLMGCASTGPKGSVETKREHDALVTVEAMDVPNRLVTVRTAGGESVTFYVDKSVKTFPQAAVGDQVRVRYVESFALTLRKPGDAIQGYEVTEETARPKPGQPAGETATEVKTTVKIEAVEQHGGKVTFTGPRGRRAVQINNPSMRDYASKLRPGDTVEVTYREALALSLEKVSR